MHSSLHAHSMLLITASSLHAQFTACSQHATYYCQFTTCTVHCMLTACYLLLPVHYMHSSLHAHSMLCLLACLRARAKASALHSRHMHAYLYAMHHACMPAAQSEAMQPRPRRSSLGKARAPPPSAVPPAQTTMRGGVQISGAQVPGCVCFRRAGGGVRMSQARWRWGAYVSGAQVPGEQVLNAQRRLQRRCAGRPARMQGCAQGSGAVRTLAALNLAAPTSSACSSITYSSRA
jgi:hypothetical protein